MTDGAACGTPSAFWDDLWRLRDPGCADHGFAAVPGDPGLRCGTPSVFDDDRRQRSNQDPVDPVDPGTPREAWHNL
jgi:hypothetical protein